MTRQEKLETIAKLWSKTMFYTDWEWENPNERVLEMVMREVGYWPYKDEDDMIAKSQVNEDLYLKAKEIIPTRKCINGKTTAKSGESPVSSEKHIS